jgi:hypothetical protein
MSPQSALYGTNRISGSRVYQLSLILHCPVSYFFETIDVEGGPAAGEAVYEAAEEADQIPADLLGKRRTVELVRAFYAIADQRQRNAALGLLKPLGKAWA